MTGPDGTTHPAQPGPTSPDELALLAAEFPAFRVWQERVHNRTRYVARGTTLDTRPHTVITDDLAELRTALAAGQRPSGP